AAVAARREATAAPSHRAGGKPVTTTAPSALTYSCRCGEHPRTRRTRSRVAQLAEQPAVNRQVIGSSPIAGATQAPSESAREAGPVGLRQSSWSRSFPVRKGPVLFFRLPA